MCFIVFIHSSRLKHPHPASDVPLIFSEFGLSFKLNRKPNVTFVHRIAFSNAFKMLHVKYKVNAILQKCFLPIFSIIMTILL